MLQVLDLIIEDDDVYQTVYKQNNLIFKNKSKEYFTCIGSYKRCLTVKRKRFICSSSFLLTD